MYWCEKHLVNALPKMINAAGNAELKAVLSEHLEVTRQQSGRLEELFDLLGIKIGAKKCDACDGLVMDGEHVIENTLPGSEARDTGIIMAGLKVENFEITCYNGLIQLANVLGKTEAADILNQNLAGEVEATDMLTSLSQGTKQAPKKSKK